MNYDRRDILRAGGLVTAMGLVGCLNFGSCVHSARFEMIPASDSEITQRLTSSVTRLGPLGQRLLRSAIDADPTTYTSCDQLFHDGVYVIDEGYYQLTTTVSETKQVTGYEIEFEVLSSETTATPPAADQIIAFDDLPEADQQALLHGFLNDILRKVGDETGADLARISGSTSICYPTDAAQDASVLVPTPQYNYIEYKGSLMQFSVQDSFETTSRTFRVQASEIATSPAAFARYAYRQLLNDPVNLDRESLTQDQRSILTNAIVKEDAERSGGYGTCVDDPSPAFEKLMQVIFDIEEDLQHLYSEKPQPVVWETERYLATYGVAVA